MVTVNLRHHFKTYDFEPQKKLNIKNRCDELSSKTDFCVLCRFKLEVKPPKHSPGWIFMLLGRGNFHCGREPTKA